eukprot:GCRY01005642.1.p1 GENE.GCRY01005642.1~~GCRY01005642.1.p1  ORF type:complete len:232 (-),score=30.30 GCRY01005642.1:34-729(-)
MSLNSTIEDDDVDFFEGSLFINTDYIEKTETFSDDTSVNYLVSEAKCTDHDLTGQILWPACHVLCEFMAENRPLFQNQKIIELGSGVGLTGLLAAHYASEMLLTDGVDLVVDLLRRNIDLNEQIKNKCQAFELEWGSENAKTFQSAHGEVDCIIAADVVYDAGVCDALFQTIDVLLSHRPEARVYLAYRSRWNVVERALFSVIEKYGFSYEKQGPQTTDQDLLCVFILKRQ